MTVAVCSHAANEAAHANWYSGWRRPARVHRSRQADDELERVGDYDREEATDGFVVSRRPY
jgi:hypothetical protein